MAELGMIGVDVGGTFTDIVSIRDGVIETAKVPTDVEETQRGVLAGAAEVGVADASAFNHASTHGLNAIITRNVPKIGFLTTTGHRDLLDIGNQVRPREALTDPRWRRSFSDAGGSPIVPRYLRRGVVERTTIDGTVLVALDEDDARAQLRVLARCRVQGVAVALINSFVNDAHERRLAELVAEELGDVPCSISSAVSPLAGEYGRASTAVVDVLMKIIYGPYAERLAAGLEDMGFQGTVNFADCAATLAPKDVAMQQPSRVVFSGPAAGTVACAHFGEMLGEGNLLCADVGGTSCDISLVTNGTPFVNTTFELEHDLMVNTLSNEINSVGAGGGSIISITPAGSIKVGPESAGARPGPACYGQGGTAPTMTDACLLIGILDGESFAGGRARLDPDLARKAFEDLDTPVPVDQRVRNAYRMGLNNIAEGVFNVVVKNGVDPRDYTLVAYGAAGPMLLSSLLDLIHVKCVVVPPHPGLFSALGLLSADQVHSDSRSAYLMLGPGVAEQVDAVYREMEDGIRDRLGPDAGEVSFERRFDGQLVGQVWDTPFIPMPGGPVDEAAMVTMVSNFHDAYEERSLNRFEALPVQGVTYRVNAIVPTPKVRYPVVPERGDEPLEPARTVTLRHLSDEDVEALEYRREDLRAGDRITGPAIVREPLSTTFLEAGHVATVGRLGEITIVRADAA
jgi:N-methylhydantoinase A